ncbi:unnamed protein product [Mytilus edulis]|uniref:Myb-like domain-containing protein n=1 Tax=Mytilus edulis TaxID=6550 RepID=A0A8S3S8F1_MYTED|nr:unnamed protein product [Mytilus edulis]
MLRRLANNNTSKYCNTDLEELVPVSTQEDDKWEVSSPLKKLVNKKDMDFQDIVIKDKTGSIEIALWDRLVGTIEKGQTIAIKKCRVKLFREEKKLNTTFNTTTEVFVTEEELFEVSSDEEVNDDEAAHISLAVGTVEAVVEVDPYLACPIASCNNVKMVTVKGEDDIYRMNCKKCHGTFRASSCNKVLPKLPARRETAIISVVKDGEIFRKFIVRTDIVTLLKLESGDEEAMSRFLEERDYVDGQVTVSILRVESSQATDMPSMSTQASTSATSQASTSATSQASTSATSLASTSAKQIPSTSSTWSKDSEKFLLDLYDKYEKSKSFIKNKWVRISQEIAEKLSIQVTPEQCRIKIRSMKDRFERMKKKLKTSGESNIEIPTEFTVFESQHDVQPKYLLDSSKPKKAESSSEEEETSNPTPSKRKMKVSTSCPEPQAKEKKKKKTTDRFELLAEASERRHTEKMECFKSLIDVMKDIAKK